MEHAGVSRVQSRIGKNGTKKAPTKAELAKEEKQAEKNLELASVYEAYEKELKERKKYDFDDMLLELIRAVENNADLKLILQEQYQYILADEHQDANAAQNRILELLADFHQSPNLFIVGDDKQAIYRFQGASLENFLYFSKKYTDATTIDLTHNYRSHQGILDASHSLIMKNPTMPGKLHVPLISLQVGSKPIQIREYTTVRDELEGVAIAVKSLISHGTQPQEIAVLYRDNIHADAVSAVLNAHSIVHHIESSRDLLKEVDIVKIIILMRAIANPSNDESLAQALLLPELGCDIARVSELCAGARKRAVSIYTEMNKDAAITKDIRKAYDRIITWAKEARTLQFPDFVQKVIQETDMISAIVKATDSQSRLETIQAFYDHIRSVARSERTFNLDSFIEYLSILEDHGMAAPKDYSEHIPGVRLMTAHRAKGLEFTHVFILHVVDGVWGNRSSRNLFTIPIIEHTRTSGRIEDERRLLYVALTRARDTATLSYALSNGERETIPSQFIAEIESNLVQFKKVNTQESDSRIGRMFRGQSSNNATKAVSGLSVIQPDFVRSRFLSQPLSVTHLNNYIQCPWRYFFVNLVRIPQAESKHQMYGTAIHSALRTFFDALKDGRRLSKNQLVDLFVHSLESQPLAAKDRLESLAKGTKALQGYYTTYEGSWNDQLVTEYAVRGIELDLGAIVPGDKVSHALQLTGKLDKIEYVDDSHVIVIDYKTGKPKSRNEIEGKTRDSDGNYKRQLVFYKLLLDLDLEALNRSGHVQKKGLIMNHGEIDFIEPNDRGIYKKERFDISPDELIELKKLIHGMAKDIVSLSFTTRTCDDKECVYCRLGGLLPR